MSLNELLGTKNKKEQEQKVQNLTNTQKYALLSFIDTMWAKAEAEVIG